MAKRSEIESAESAASGESAESANASDNSRKRKRFPKLPSSNTEASKTFQPLKRLQPISAVELARLKLKKPSRYWGDYIVSGRLILVCGWRGIGKSQFVMGLAVSMSTGAEFLGYAPRRPRKVVLLDGEMDLQTLQERLLRTTDALGTQHSKRLRFMSPEASEAGMPSPGTPEGQAQIDEAIGDEWDVLIIDNYSSFSGRREDVEAWTPWAKWLMRHRRAGRTVILVHHTGKNGQQRGASNHEDAMDATIMIRPAKAAAEDATLQFVVSWAKARHLPPDKTRPMVVTYRQGDSGPGSWTKSDEADLDADRAKALELVRAGKSLSEIGRELGKDKSTISRWLKDWKASGQGE